MLDAVRAETLKLARHRATWLMVWIYPLGIALLVAAQLVRDLTAGPALLAPQSAASWIADSAMVWAAPMSAVGRFLIAGFAALVFAGEYGWNTWKLIIPARPRSALIAAKWIVCVLLVVAGFVAADLIGMAATLLRAAIHATTIPDGVTIGSTIAAHATAAVNALPVIAYTVVFAGSFAVLTSSLLAAVILSVALIFLEQLLLPLGMLAYSYASSPTLLLVEALPFYHVANVLSWTKGMGFTLPLGGTVTVSLSWLQSLTALCAWIAAAGAATLTLFNRQDLN